MKLTESQLRKIIREELEAMREVKIADFVDRYKEIAKEAGFYYPPGGVVNNLARIAAEKQRLEIPTEKQMAAFRNQAAKELGIPAGPMDEAIENYDLFFDKKVKPLFAPHAPKNEKERAAFFQRVRRKIGTRKLDDIKKNILFYANQAKAK